MGQELCRRPMSEFMLSLWGWGHRQDLILCCAPLPGVPQSGDFGSWCGFLLLAHTAVDCLMLWKLTRVGEVGMDMALATRARMECLSCQRCHRFRTADLTWARGTRDVWSPHRGCSEAPAILLSHPAKTRLMVCDLVTKQARVG